MVNLFYIFVHKIGPYVSERDRYDIAQTVMKLELEQISAGACLC